MAAAALLCDDRLPGVYALRSAQTGREYVGKSAVSIRSRVAAHRKLDPTYQRQALLTAGTVDDLESWERGETLARMRAHGVDQVRGWMYVKARLSAAQKADIRRQLAERYDLCRGCGQEGHFRSACPLVRGGTRRSALGSGKKAKAKAKPAAGASPRVRVVSSRRCNQLRARLLARTKTKKKAG